MLVGFLLLFVASWQLLGALLTVRVLLLGVMLYFAGLWVFFVRRAARALRARETRTMYGPVALAERPTLFTVLLALQILMPLALIGIVIFLQAPHVQLFRWIVSIWTQLRGGTTL
jgi:hypothetical protein